MQLNKFKVDFILYYIILRSFYKYMNASITPNLILTNCSMSRKGRINKDFKYIIL